MKGALKLAKRFTGRSRIISFRNSYHGSTHGALSIQGSEQYRNAFRPLFLILSRSISMMLNALDSIDKKTACVIIEPVQAEAGVIYPEDGFLEKVRRKCTETTGPADI